MVNKGKNANMSVRNGYDRGAKPCGCCRNSNVNSRYDNDGLDQ